LALAAGATLYFLSENPSPPPAAAVAVKPVAAAPLTAVERGLIPAPVLTVGNSNETSNPTEYSGDKFYADSEGQLVLNEQARLHIEALVALTEPGKLYATTQEEVQKLPPAAAARANDLVARYTTYMQAQYQAYPPGIAPLNEEDMLAQLDGLHALRMAHFGAEAAAALYGSEEKLNRELLELMRLEKDNGLTMEEKAERASVLRDKLQHVAEVERYNREIGKLARQQPESK